MTIHVVCYGHSLAHPYDETVLQKLQQPSGSKRLEGSLVQQEPLGRQRVHGKPTWGAGSTPYWGCRPSNEIPPRTRWVLSFPVCCPLKTECFAVLHFIAVIVHLNIDVSVGIFHWLIVLLQWHRDNYCACFWGFKLLAAKALADGWILTFPLDVNNNQYANDSFFSFLWLQAAVGPMGVGRKEARRLSLLQTVTGKVKTHLLSVCVLVRDASYQISHGWGVQRITEEKWSESMTMCSVACSYPETPSPVDPEFK